MGTTLVSTKPRQFSPYFAAQRRDVRMNYEHYRKSNESDLSQFLDSRLLESNPPQALVGSGSPSRTSTRIGDRVFRSAVKAASADTQGFAGLEDEVDHHRRRLFTAAALSTLLGVGAELGAANNDSAIGLIHGEIAVDEIGRLARPIPHGRDGALATAHADQTSVQHQPGNTFATDTYIPTWGGFLYLAVVLDAFSRRIVGWSMATTLHMQVVLDALNMALWQRRPSGVIHHSDHGSQYTSIEFGKRCREAGVRPSMGSVGDAYDNGDGGEFLRPARM